MDSYLLKDQSNNQKISPSSQVLEIGLAEYVSLVYHNLFDYPLTQMELVRWSAGGKTKISPLKSNLVFFQNGLFFLTPNKGLILKRHLRQRASQRKLKKLKHVIKFLEIIPTLKMVAITGSLAMENAQDEDDIDLMVVCQQDCLWLTRAMVFLLLRLLGLPLRKPRERDQKDKYCFNIWLDEADLIWPQNKRNVFTAHEIAQIRPIINRDKTYEQFLWKNKWIEDYWPNAVPIRPVLETKAKGEEGRWLGQKMEKIAFKLQYWYMRKKITKEVVTPTRALFHPVDWSQQIMELLDK